MPKKKGEKLPDPKVWDRCIKDGCEEYAIFLKDKCWNHLSIPERNKYKTEIESRISSGGTCVNANFKGVDLKKAKFNRVDEKNPPQFTGANFEEANISEAEFRGAALSHAVFKSAIAVGTDFREAILTSTSFEGASLSFAKMQGANLNYALLQRASLTETNLEGAHLEEANLREAELEKARLHKSFLYRVKLEGAFNIEGDNILEKIGEEHIREWRKARHTYSRLKGYFKQQGRDEDASKAYYREAITAKHHLHERICGLRPVEKYRRSIRTFGKLIGIRRIRLFRVFATSVLFINIIGRAFQNIKRFFDCTDYKYGNDEVKRTDRQRRRWLGYWFFHVFAGFGQRWLWTAGWALGFILLFSFIYWIGHSAGCFLFDFKPDMLPHLNFFSYIYLSVVTFATLGFGDITPLNPAAQIPVVIEVIMGYVFLGLIITIIARRFGR